jgi:hypothetical protein
MRVQIINLILLTFTINVFAGWRDHSPIPINANSNPGEVNVHANSGGRRIVRINNVTIALAAELGGEKTYRSSNNGQNWQEIDNNNTYSGCLITGKNEMVYHFYRYDTRIYMVKFKYNDDPPDPVNIYDNPAVGTTQTGVYRTLNATVDSSGNIYIAIHWGEPDQMYMLSSSNEGQSWTDPVQVSSGNGVWYYPHIEVSANNILYCVYNHWDTHAMYVAKSIDAGETWTRKLISQEQTYNNSLLTAGSNDLYVFAQSGESDYRGLVFNHSGNQGEDWDGWELIDPTCGYADPSPGLGNDGTIYVAFRSSNGSGLTGGSCGDQSKSRLAMSSNSGQTWSFPDDYYAANERVGTRSQIRYQTWFNYGGPLEWIWMQYTDGGAQHPTYYDINTDVTIQSNISTPANYPQLRTDIEKAIKQYKESPTEQNKQNVEDKIDDYLTD